VIDPRRDPLDCCWSNYRFPFHHGHPASTRLDWLGQFYSAYDAVLDAASQAHPGRLRRIGYEALVEHPAEELGSLFGWLDLEFEEQCLDFHNSAAPVATASSEQVREPLNRKGIGAHEPYRQWLRPLETALAER
jgi:hypothetical protein